MQRACDKETGLQFDRVNIFAAIKLKTTAIRGNLIVMPQNQLGN